MAGLANAQNQPPAQKISTNTDFSKIFPDDKAKNSYALGMSWGNGLKSRFKSQNLDYDAESMSKGFKDALGAGPTLITEEQEAEILRDFKKEMDAKREEKQKQMAEENRIKGEKNKADGAAFLASNKNSNGVVTLPDGLQYKVITDGSGPSPKGTDNVTVNYRGTLIDGTEFDSSAKAGHPFTTRVQGGVIKGWSEVLQLMKAGSKWQVFIPSDLAYGANPKGPLIGPNATLIFEMELVSFQTPPPPTAQTHAPPSAPLTSDIIKVPSAEEIKKGAKIETIKAEDLEKEKEKVPQ